MGLKGFKDGPIDPTKQDSSAELQDPPTYQDSVPQSVYPPGPLHTQATTRTLHFYYETWRENSMSVTDSDKSTVLYVAKIRVRKPHMTFQRPTTNADLAIVSFHILSSRIEITLHGQSVLLNSKGMFKNGYSFVSPTFRNETMTWKRDNCSTDIAMVCVDGADVPVARIAACNWSVKKLGKMELFGPKAQSGDTLDEIVVTGLAVLQVALAGAVAGAVA